MNCGACGAALVEDARFCRECGAPAVATAPAPPPDPTCASCGSAFNPGQRFCRICGAALEPDPRAGYTPTERPRAAPVPPAMPPRQPAVRTVLDPLQGRAAPPPELATADRGPIIRRRRIIAGFVALLLLAAGGAAAILLLAGGDENRDGGTDTTTGAITTGDGAVVATAEPLRQGRYAQLGSFRRPATAEREAARLRAEGLRTVVQDSNQLDELLPAFWVVVAGPLTSEAAEERALAQAERAGVSGARVRLMTPAAGASEKPRASYRGTLNRRADAGSPLNRSITMTMAFAGDGETGTVSLDVPSCTGDLRLTSTKGAVRAYTENVTRGDCLDGGQWSVKVRGSDLLVTWWHPDRTYFIVGTLSAT